MRIDPLEIPPDILTNKNLNESQKLILSALSTKPKMYAIDVSKRIGSNVKHVKQELTELAKLNYVISTNGGNRESYSRSKGLGFVADEIKPEPKLTIKNFSSYNNNNNINNYNLAKAKLIVSSEKDLAFLAMEYWLKNGGTKHREGSDIYNAGIECLIKLFQGTMFSNVLDESIPKPLLNKKRKFTLEDWKTSIDNMNLAANDYAYLPKDKNKFKKYIKRLTLKDFIYNIFLKPNQHRSMFLQYLESPKRVSTAVPKYPRLSNYLIKAFEYDKIKRFNPQNKDILITAANKYGDLISKHKGELIYNYKKESIVHVVELFVDFITGNFDLNKFKQQWLVSDWLFEKLEQWLVTQGLIRL